MRVGVVSPEQVDYLKLSGYWILASLIFRACLALLMPLGTDEAYALAVGRSFSLSFFDHPPIGFWSPAIMEYLFNSNEFFLRLPNLIIGSLAQMTLFRIGVLLGGNKVGYYTVVIAVLSPLSYLGGLLIIPDTYLFLGLLLAFLVLLKLIDNPELPMIWWVLGGCAFAIALASKYQAGLVVLAVLVWLLISSKYRVWLSTFSFWLAVCIAFLGVLPMLFWNFENDWASFQFHSSRAGSGLNLSNFLTMFLAQGFYLYPVFLWYGFKSFFYKQFWLDDKSRILLIGAVIPILFFNVIYWFSSSSLPHWTMPGWLLLLPLISVLISQLDPKVIKSVIILPSLAIHVLVFLFVLHLQTGLVTIFHKEPPAWDNTVPLVPSSLLTDEFEEYKASSVGKVIVAENWMEAGRLAHLFGPNVTVNVLGQKKNHFRYLPGNDYSGEVDFIKITSLKSRSSDNEDALDLARQYDPYAVLEESLILKRGSRDYFRLLIIKMKLP